MRQHWLINSLISIVLFVLASLAVAGMAITQAQAQTVSLPGLSSGSEEQAAEVSGAEFQRSLDDVITMLENEQQRTELLKSLRELQVTADAASADDSVVRQGLLGALADTLSDLGDQAQAGDSPVDQWSRQLVQGAEDLRALNDDADQGEAIRAIVEGAVLALVWGVLLVVMIAFGRMVATRREWPLDLPRDPKGWLMAVHFLRRMLPWAIFVV